MRTLAAGSTKAGVTMQSLTLTIFDNTAQHMALASFVWRHR
jgi:hypothetical protein